MKGAEKEEREARQGTNTCSMNGGDGPNSYARNSSYQRHGATMALTMIKEGIARELDLKHFPSIINPRREAPFRIADLGCSVGPNTFLLVGATIEAVTHKYYSEYSDGGAPEFQAFFNDIASNDFNTLIRSPQWGINPQHYFAAAVPGSFHGRLFPVSSLHFVLCFYALHWMSRLPTEVLDESSPAWNKGKITCFDANREVSAAFLRQFAVDIDCFLRAREDEVVVGGLMALIIPFQQEEYRSDLKALFNVLLVLLDAVLSDLVILGRLDESAVDSFNFPAYVPTANEFRNLVEKNGSFSMEMLQPITVPTNMAFDARALSSGVRAIVEVTMSTHFPSEIIDEIFDRHREKIQVSSHLVIPSMEVSQDIFVLLKRKSS